MLPVLVIGLFGCGSPYTVWGGGEASIHLQSSGNGPSFDAVVPGYSVGDDASCATYLAEVGGVREYVVCGSVDAADVDSNGLAGASTFDFDLVLSAADGGTGELSVQFGSDPAGSFVVDGAAQPLEGTDGTVTAGGTWTTSDGSGPVMWTIDWTVDSAVVGTGHGSPACPLCDASF